MQVWTIRATKPHNRVCWRCHANRCRNETAPVLMGAVVRAFLAADYRELSDSPILNAFCRVAPSVRFKARAMFAALVFLFA